MTAEGVETAAILAALKGIGQMKGQGYLYGMPEDASTTRERLAALKLLADSRPEPEAAAPAHRKAS